MQAHSRPAIDTYYKGRFLDLKSGDLVLLLDVSSSMQSSIDALRSFLSQIRDALMINAITSLHLVKFSDWDRSSNTPNTPNPMQVCYVVSGSPDDIISVLRATVAGEYGTGGSGDEAHCTALNLVLQAVRARGDSQGTAGINCVLISDAPPHPAGSTHKDAITERTQMRMRDLPEQYGASVLLAEQLGVRVCTIAIGATAGRLPVTPDDISFMVSSMSMLPTSLSLIMAHFLGVEKLPIPSTRDCTLETSITARVCRKTMSSIMVNPDHHEAYFERVMTFFNTYPNLVPAMASISVAFFQCLRQLPQPFRDRWSLFAANFRTSYPQHAGVIDEFIKTRVNNIDEIVVHLQTSGIYNDDHIGSSIVLGDSGQLSPAAMIDVNHLPADLPATHFGHFMSDDTDAQLRKVIDGLTIKTGRWFPPVIDENLVIKPTYYPLGEGTISVPTFISFLTGFKTLSSAPITFRFALWLARYATKIMDPILREAIHNSAVCHIRTHISTCLPWLVDSSYRQKVGMDYVPPWFNLTALHMMLMVCQMAGIDIAITDRIRRLISIRQYLSHGNEAVTVEGRSTPVINKELVRLVTCPGGSLMPETLTQGQECIYCTGVHPDGRGYHQDGTEPLTAHLTAEDGTPLSTWRYRCRYCMCYYAIVDQRLGKSVPRCFNCRTGKELGQTSPIVSCSTCGDRWVMSHPRPADWQCAGCVYGVSSTTITYNKTTMHALARGNQAVRHALLGAFPGLPSVLFDSPFKGKFSDATAPEILHWREPAPAPTPGPAPVLDSASDITNIESIIRTIELYHQEQECCIGQCSGKSSLISPCGSCTMMACRGCLHRMMTFPKGSTVPRSATLCFCRRPFSAATLHKIGKGEARVPKMLAEMGDDGCVHICLCEGDMTRCQRYVAGRLVADCAGAHADADPDDPVDPALDINYRCPSCLQNHLSQSHSVKVETTEEMIKSLSAIAQPGTVLRLCPGSCGTYQMRMEDNYCAHMQCPHRECRVHWCWICRACFSSNSECYDHMNDMTDNVMDPFHIDRVWTIGATDPVDPHDSDVVVGGL